MTPSIAASTDDAAPLDQLDADGNCVRHPTIRVKRRSRATGDWKNILGSCPLCAVRGTTPRRNRPSEGSISGGGESEAERRDRISAGIRSSVLSRQQQRGEKDDDDDDNEDGNDHHRSGEDDDALTPLQTVSKRHPLATTTHQLRRQSSGHSVEDDGISLLTESTSGMSLCCKEVSSLSDRTDATVASSCTSASSSQQSNSNGLEAISELSARRDRSRRSRTSQSAPGACFGASEGAGGVWSYDNQMTACQPCSAPPPPPPRRSSNSRKGLLGSSMMSLDRPPPPPPPRRTSSSKSLDHNRSAQSLGGIYDPLVSRRSSSGMVNLSRSANLSMSSGGLDNLGSLDNKARNSRSFHNSSSHQSLPQHSPKSTPKNSGTLHYSRTSSGDSRQSSHDNSSNNTPNNNMTPRRESYSRTRESQTSSSQVAQRDSSSAVVCCGLRYTNPSNHRRGSYTGQLNPDSQVPDGIGTLRYSDGSVCEGEWRDGMLVKQSGVMEVDNNDYDGGGADGKVGGPNSRRRTQDCRQESHSRRGSGHGDSLHKSDRGTNHENKAGRRRNSQRRDSALESLEEAQAKIRRARSKSRDGRKVDPAKTGRSKSRSGHRESGPETNVQLVCAPCSPMSPTEKKIVGITGTTPGSRGSQRSHRRTHSNVVVHPQAIPEPYRTNRSDHEDGKGHERTRSRRQPVVSSPCDVKGVSRPSPPSSRKKGEGPYSAQESKGALPAPPFCPGDVASGQGRRRPSVAIGAGGLARRPTTASVRTRHGERLAR